MFSEFTDLDILMKVFALTELVMSIQYKSE
jgi:hypothetical protein